jgi:hypothetical protein
MTTVHLGLICGFLSGIYGSFKGGEVKPIFLAGSAAFNSAVAGATFFGTVSRPSFEAMVDIPAGVREYVISPALVSTLPWKQYVHRKRHFELSAASGRQTASLAESTDEPVTLSDLRTHKLLDTGLSGAITGGVLNSLKRASIKNFFTSCAGLITNATGGRAGIISGIATGALFCAALQLGYNQILVSRVKLAARRIGGPSIETEPAKSATERVLTALGFQISDETYLARLKATRDKHLERIRQLEKKAEEERKEI